MAVKHHAHTSTNRRILYTAAAATLLAPPLLVASAAAAYPPSPEDTPDTSTPSPETPATDALVVETLTTGLKGAGGGTVGPDGALYVAEGAAGTVTRIDPETGGQSTYASGLPLQTEAVGIGGAIDVEFVDDTAYVLVTLPGSEVSDETIHGIYRVDGTDDYTIIADLGEWSRDNPVPYPVDLPSGVQFAFEAVDDGFLVTDGHHNRVLHVDWDGVVTELIAFENIVPTGIDSLGETIYLGEAGPIPHNPEDGKVVSFTVADPSVETVAAGYSLVVDVAVGGDDAVYALSQGDSPGDVPAGSPALPDSGKLVVANDDGTFTSLVDEIDLPRSLQFIDEDAYVVTLEGDVLKISGVIPADDGDGDGGDGGGGYDHGDKGHDGDGHGYGDGRGDGRGDRHDHHGHHDHAWDHNDE